MFNNADFPVMVAIAYVSGSLPWSVWLSTYFKAVDPRTMTDGNPGAANAFRAAGWGVGAAALLLDFFKAFLPVVVAYHMIDYPPNQMFWIALAPMLGHAFSIFLNFRGGRGIATLFGVWAGLTLYAVPVAMGLAAVAALWLIKNDELKTLLLPVVALGYLFIMNYPAWMPGVALAQFLILLVKIIPFLLSSRQLQQKQGVE